MAKIITDYIEEVSDLVFHKIAEILKVKEDDEEALKQCNTFLLALEVVATSMQEIIKEKGIDEVRDRMKKKGLMKGEK